MNVGGVMTDEIWTVSREIKEQENVPVKCTGVQNRIAYRHLKFFYAPKTQVKPGPRKRVHLVMVVASLCVAEVY